ncbi:hypothetical protein ACFQ3W_04280 [Paenibacillus puldeungensis]|uniref:Uncharacterized protein n=1 Tax=Paenibacillus puldeungensis TaxID=696536 RepID=A0ABW3RSQ4_9BACL
MKIKQVIIVGTMAFVITLSPSLSGYLSSLAYAANPSKPTSFSSPDKTENPRDELNSLLGMSSDQEVYEALLEGQSLADIAESHEQDADRVIDLQVDQMKELLMQRVLQGSLSQEAYEEQVRELPELIANSVHTRYAAITS